jgi:oxalate decarboxylase/phosphoglucose isomerase-like protein (cupin superfamily)
MRIHLRRGSVMNTLAVILIAVCFCRAQSAKSAPGLVPIGSPKPEEIPHGAGISKHKHLGQDESLLIQTGTAHVWLSDQERDLHAGGLVFIPSSTWIRLKNIGAESISLVGIFSAPGF